MGIMQSKTRNKRRYIHKQKHKYTCGAVALANAFRKLGKHVTYKQAVAMFGGLRAFEAHGKKKFNGVSNRKIELVARRNGLRSVAYHLTLEEVKLLSSLKNVAVAVCYVPVKNAGHIVTFNKRGQPLNAGRYGVTEKHWALTKKVWGFEPVCFIFTRKR